MKLQPIPANLLAALHPGLEALEDGFFMVDDRWRVTYWNAAAAEMLGIERRQVLGQDLWQSLPSLREASSWDVFRRVVRTQQPHRYLDILPGQRDGFVSMHAAPLEGGGIAVHFRDANEEVKQAEQYSALLESIQDGFIAVDPEWRVVYMNSVAESLLRLRRERAEKVMIWSLLPRGPAEIADCLKMTMEDGLKRHLRGVRPEGRVFRGRIYDLWTYPLAGGGISILFEDVSERVRREKKLARLAEEAREANRAKSRFYAAISHELRTPLNAIVGYTHLLSSGTYGELSDQAERAATRAGICAEHLSRLVDDLLVLTATEVKQLPVAPYGVDLERFLANTVGPYRHQAESKGLTFELRVAADVPIVESDPERLRQLLGRLLNNAVKFTSRGSVVVEIEAAGEAVLIAVVDSGPGISKEDAERIFDPFERLGEEARSNPMAHGSGLGLTVAGHLAQLLGGRLYLANSSEAGSRFNLVLPREQKPRAPL